MKNLLRIEKIKDIFASFMVILCLISFLLISSPIIAEQSIQSIFNEALQLTNKGDFYQALQVWNKLLEFDPENALALSNRGNIKLALGDPEGAVVDQSKSMKILPNEADSHLNRGIAEEALGLWSEAEKDYDWILHRDPEDSSALYNLGNIKIAQGNWTEAEALFHKAALLRPAFAMARSSSALALYQLGSLDKAEVELRNLIRRYPMFADARAALTALLWRKGSFGEAESNWAAAAGLDSRYKQQDWLLQIRRWPPEPSKDLLAFLDLEAL